MNKYDTLAALMLSKEMEYNNGIYFVHPEEKDEYVSYGKLLEEAKRTLSFFRENNVKQGDKIILQIEDNHKFLVVFWACIIGGIVVVPLAAETSVENLSRLLNVYSILKDGYIVTSKNKGISILDYGKEQNFDIQVLSSNFIYMDLIEECESDYEQVDISANDLAVIQFSSGSAGMQKGILLSHYNLVFDLEKIKKRIRLEQGDVNVFWLPLTYGMGLIGCHLLNLLCNSDQVEIAISDYMQSPYVWLEALSRYKADYTITSGPSLEMAKLSIDNRKDINLDFSKLRTIICGGEMIQPEKCRLFLEAFKPYGLPETALFPAYGMAETTLGIALPDPYEVFSPLMVDTTSFVVGKQIKYSTTCTGNSISEMVDSGYAIDECEIRICDNQGNILGEDMFGIIEIKGPCVFLGYFNSDIKKPEPIEWYRSKDYGFLHNGRLVVAGRLDDAIIISGHNYFITDLRQVVKNAHSVIGREATVCKKIDKKTGEEDFAIFVEYSDSLESFINVVIELRELFLKYGFLKAKYIVPIDEIPKSDLGKHRNVALEKRISTGEFNYILNEIDELIRSNSENREKNESNTEDNLYLLLDIWRKITGESINPDDNFFSLGIDSMLISKFAAIISNVTGKDLQISDVFCCSTMEEVSRIL